MRSRERFEISSRQEFEDEVDASTTVSNDFFAFYNVLVG